MFKQWLNHIESRIIDISGKDYDVRPLSFEYLLVIISKCYESLIRLRISVFRYGLFRQKSLPCKVISIGNVVAGGTGKTPMAVYMANLLKNQGMNVVIISRGYKGNYGDGPQTVFDGKTILMTPDESGDEPYIMAQVGQFPVIVGKDRVKAGLYAIKHFEPDVIVLDDAFQHLRLKRDFNILLLDAAVPFGNGRCLPAGRLREPVSSSIHRCDVIVFTRSPDAIDEYTDRIMKQAIEQYKSIPNFISRHLPVIRQVVNKRNDTDYTIFDKKSLKGMNAVVFSGLANNRAFLESLLNLGINVNGFLEFGDHHAYKEADIEKINRLAVAKKSKMIVTTEKDWVKCSQYKTWNADIIVMGVDIEVEAEEKLIDLIKRQRLSNER